MKKEALTAVIEYFEEHEQELTEAIEELDSYNGYLGDNRYYEMYMLNEFYADTEPLEFLNRIFYGYDEDTSSDNNRTEFNPNREYFSYNGYGNLVSSDYKDYSCYLDKYFVESLYENMNSLNLNDEIIELLAALDDTEDD